MRVWLLLLFAACSTPPKTLVPAPSSLSEAIARAMKGRAGAVVVMDGRGQILAQHNPQTAQQRAFPVGSAIKPFIAKAIQDRSRTYYCRGAYRIGSLKLLCTHSRQKDPLDLAHALALSCNGYFASLSKELYQRETAALLQKHGFSRSKALFNPQTEEERANFLIGETDRISMTPVAFTEAMLSLAKSPLPVEIVAGLKGTVEYGTGADSRWKRTLSRPEIVVLGKTGSPTIPGDVLTHGWFTALVCKDRKWEEEKPTTSSSNEKPLEVDFAITVFLETGRGHEAATVAAEIVDTFLESTSKPKGDLDVALFSPLEPREALLHSNSMRLRDASGRLLLQSKRLRLSAAGSGILIQPEEGESLVLERLLVEADGGISVRVEGALARSHRGWISVTLGKRPQTLLILERVDLESYVAGVVTAEIPEEAQMEALKAQAVAARSFAASALSSARHTYGLCSSTHCQRYEGNSSPKALEASRQTAGEYLLDIEGRPARTLFHSCCGSKRLTAERVWGEQATSPVFCKYCTGHNLWQRKFSKRQVMAVFESHTPRNFRLISRDGACLRLEVSSQHISCGDLLESLGVPSPPNNLLMQGDEILLSGQGQGHAVGLCQHAAHSLATEGRDYLQILSEFYPHLRLSKYIPNSDAPSAQTVYEKRNVSVTYTAPNTSEDAKEVAEIALEAAKELEQYSDGLKFQFLLHPDTSSFRKATGLAGDSAGASTGGRIHLQPLKRLRELKMLRQTIRHEMMHLAIERVGGLSTARWFHEGYAVIFAGERVSGGQPMSLQELECALLKASSLEQRQKLYSAAAARVQTLLREGEQKLWRDLAAGRFRSLGCR